MSDRDSLAPLPTKQAFHFLRTKHQSDFDAAVEETLTIDQRLAGKVLSADQVQLLRNGLSDFKDRRAALAVGEILIRLVASAYLQAKWDRLRDKDAGVFAAATCNIGPAPLNTLATAQTLTESHEQYDKIAASFDLYRELLEIAARWEGFEEQHAEALGVLENPYRPQEAIDILRGIREAAVEKSSVLEEFRIAFETVAESVRQLESGYCVANEEVEEFLARNPMLIQRTTDRRLVHLAVPHGPGASLQAVEDRRHLVYSLTKASQMSESELLQAA